VIVMLLVKRGVLRLLLRTLAGYVALGLSILAVSPSLAKLPLRDITADGTWDCKDLGGAFTGTIVVAEKTYAFINTDGTVGGYGTLFQLDYDRALPLFVIMSGYMKDELHAAGLNMGGPRGNVDDFSGELFLNVTPSVEGALDWQCVRREAS
jgi:hypothetical protein